ncbi:MAG: hypothetical protein JST93_14765 [Acidobacteria bacterium]|nr:hypothetical protein [Acidobacteriota bacterium]
MAILNEKQHAHTLMERLDSSQISTAVRFLEFMLLDPLARSLATASVEDKPVFSEEAAALDEARASLHRGEGIPHEEIVREFGLSSG